MNILLTNHLKYCKWKLSIWIHELTWIYSHKYRRSRAPSAANHTSYILFVQIQHAHSQINTSHIISPSIGRGLRSYTYIWRSYLVRALKAHSAWWYTILRVWFLLDFEYFFVFFLCVILKGFDCGYCVFEIVDCVFDVGWVKCGWFVGVVLILVVRSISV